MRMTLPCAFLSTSGIVYAYAMPSKILLIISDDELLKGCSHLFYETLFATGLLYERFWSDRSDLESALSFPQKRQLPTRSAKRLGPFFCYKQSCDWGLGKTGTSLQVPKNPDVQISRIPKFLESRIFDLTKSLFNTWISLESSRAQ